MRGVLFVLVFFVAFIFYLYFILNSFFEHLLDCLSLFLLSLPLQSQVCQLLVRASP